VEGSAFAICASGFATGFGGRYVHPFVLPSKLEHDSFDYDLSVAPNQVYYFEIGKGQWTGKFGFYVTDWKAFWADKIGIKNRFLVFCLVSFVRVFGKPTIDSEVEAFPDKGTFGVATNKIRIHKGWLTVWTSTEEYVLDPNGTGVEVKAHERYGPIPFLFREDVTYSATIHPPGTSSTYIQPAVGTTFESSYQAAEDHDHVQAEIKGRWAQASEVIHRVGAGG